MVLSCNEIYRSKDIDVFNIRKQFLYEQEFLHLWAGSYQQLEAQYNLQYISHNVLIISIYNLAQ